MSVIPLDFVEAPASTPPLYGLLSAALVIEDPDPHAGFGFEYVPDFCGPAALSAAACMATPAVGDLAITSGANRTVSMSLTGTVDGTYNVDWGDGQRGTFPDPPGTAQHVYAANGDYLIRVTGPNGAWERRVTASVAGAGVSPGTVGRWQKTANGWDLVEGEPFVVYSASECNAVGGVGNARDRATRSLTIGEGRGVEEWLGDRLTAEAVDIGTGTAVSLEVGLAALEQYVHCNYGGRGTIHVSRAVGSLLLSDRALDTDGTHLTTRLGNLVSAGCYGTGTGVGAPPAPSAEQYIYATGTVMLRRGPVWSVPDPVLDPMTNRLMALAERPYAGSWECFAVKIKVGGAVNRTTTPTSTPGEPGDVTTGSDTIEGPGGSWTPPTGTLRGVSIVITSGSVEVNGDEVTAPNTVNFDADTGEELTAPTITANSAGDRAVVNWTAVP